MTQHFTLEQVKGFGIHKFEVLAKPKFYSYVGQKLPRLEVTVLERGTCNLIEMMIQS